MKKRTAFQRFGLAVKRQTAKNSTGLPNAAILNGTALQSGAEPPPVNAGVPAERVSARAPEPRTEGIRVFRPHPPSPLARASGSPGRKRPNRKLIRRTTGSGAVQDCRIGQTRATLRSLPFDGESKSLKPVLFSGALRSSNRLLTGGQIYVA